MSDLFISEEAKAEIKAFADGMSEQAFIEVMGGPLDMMQELKHSIQTHLTICGGPTPQLAVFLIKIVDLVEDEDAERKRIETNALAYAIAESVALHIQRHVDGIEDKHKTNPLYQRVKQRADNILITMGQCRSAADKTAAKNAVLAAAAATIAELELLTGKKYPSLTNSERQPY